MKKAVKWGILAAIAVAIIAAIIAVVIVFVVKKNDEGKSEPTTVEPIGPKTSAKPATGQTTKDTQKSTKPTEPPGPTPNPNGLHCLFVGDLYTFGSNAEKYQKQMELFGDIGYDFFEETPISRIGLWAYGHTKLPKKPDLSKMSNNLDEFVNDLHNMAYEYNADPLNTENAIKTINELQDDGSMVNCLVFFSARQDTYSLPKLDPANNKFKRIVAVGYNNTDLSGVVGSRGVAIKVPYYYLDGDVSTVIDAIMGREIKTTTPWTVPPRTTRRTVPTREPTTTTTEATTTKVRPSSAWKCLMVGDMTNLGPDPDRYDAEANLIGKLAYDFLHDSDGELALWAYGNTEFSKTVNDSLKTMYKTYEEFSRALNKMDYTKVANPWSSADAINAINDMYDSQNRVNCLVFFSADILGSMLPKLNPKNTKFEKIIAVGFNNANLIYIIPSYGKAFRVPFHYVEEEVTPIVNEMLASRRTTVKRTTTKPTTTTTTAPPLDEQVHCLFAGDLYNYKDDVDAYDLEADLMDAVAHDLFEVSPQSSLGLWAYGYTNFSKNPSTSLGKIRKNYKDFKGDLVGFEYIRISDPLDTEAAIKALNAMQDNGKRINCLVFFSSTKGTNGLPKINPAYLGLEKVVAVGLDSEWMLKRSRTCLRMRMFQIEDHIADLSACEIGLPSIPESEQLFYLILSSYHALVADANLNALLPSNGIAVSVPKAFLDSHVNQIVNAIRKRLAPKTTTRKPTTRVPRRPFECLFVGDLYNYGDDVDSYDWGGDLMEAVAFDLFDASPASTVSLWAYGYTNFSKNPSTSLEKMRGDYEELEGDLAGFGYVKIGDPLTTKAAIEALNAMQDPKKRINCLVFFSAAKNARELPKINPAHLGLEKIVAVGLDCPHQQQPGDRPAGVLFQSLPENLANLALEQSLSFSAPGQRKPHCLFVQDLYNYGEDIDSYELETELMDAVAYDLHVEFSKASLGLWGYGYTNHSKDPSKSLENMRQKYGEFKSDLAANGFVKINDPLTTKGAIEALNAMQDSDNRIDCLVFFSAVKKMKGLPTIEPLYLDLASIVAVGLDKANLRALVPNGAAVSVPKHFLDGDVKDIVNAIKFRP
ncbi:hypothetical protein Y032_0073g746 [Ancylostoma ceylanicum]|uniref:Uncharacterized protein n=1 Tax=Ancylostoma ceylanicum TaxID=53326 RepID=A0A016TVT6_9BILA|nr:hypothetical protein Y032_0073g746 [Ancylostoma ceylanicum]